MELIFSTITQTNPFFKPTRIADGVTERKHHLCTAVEPVRTAAAFGDIVRSGLHLDSLITATTDGTMEEESETVENTLVE